MILLMGGFYAYILLLSQTYTVRHLVEKEFESELITSLAKCRT
jgi:hypothetical protein